MFKFSRQHRQKKGNLVLALDIGTECVKALLIEVKGHKGHIVGYGRKRQQLGDMHHGAVMDIASVIENSKLAIADAERQAGGVANQLILGIAGELVKGDTTRLTYTRKNPEDKIDLSELKNIVHKVQWKCFEEVRSRLAEETGYNEIDIKLVNAAIVDMEIDGYKVSNPIGFQGKEVHVSIFNAFAPLIHYGALQTIGAELNMDLLAITVEPYAVARSLSHEDGGGDFNGVFIDIGGGTTDVAVVKNGGVIGTKMFTLGGRVFTKRLAQLLNVSFHDAEEIKIAYSNDQLEKQSYKVVREAMKMDADVWVSGVELSLQDFHQEVLPNRIFLCGGGSHLPEIKEILESPGWWKDLPFTAQPKVRFLTPKDIVSLEDKTKKLKDPRDVTPMALANIALELAGEEQVLLTLLKKVVRLMQV